MLHYNTTASLVHFSGICFFDNMHDIASFSIKWISRSILDDNVSMRERPSKFIVLNLLLYILFALHEPYVYASGRMPDVALATSKWNVVNSPEPIIKIFLPAGNFVSLGRNRLQWGHPRQTIVVAESNRYPKPLGATFKLWDIRWRKGRK